ncbi:MAG: hypothetical protein WEE67_03595 [Chloroflexota bacterium]
MSQVSDRGRPTITTRLGVSLPSAIGALLFAGALAFGSGMIDAVAPQQGGDATAQLGSQPSDGHNDGHNDGGNSKPGATYQDDKQEPDHSRPDQTPKPEPTPKPQPVEPPKPAPPAPPAPPATATGLALSLETFDAKVKLTWSVFEGDGFAYYKVVRSSDADVTWPTGAGDTLVAAVGDRWATLVKDFPPCNTNWYYRVFAVMSGDTGYATLAVSNVATAYVACAVKPTHPPVYQMGFSAQVIDGQVHLTWEQCTSDGFAAYKVVRSQTNTDPKYPLNSGSELIAAIGDPNVTSLVDGNVSSGQTWHYRVLSMANDGSGWYPLGMTPVVTVTIP